MSITRQAVRRLVAVAFSVALVCAPTAARAAGHVFSTGPSAFCHVTDGAFTDCAPGGGAEEWSDISFLAGLGTSAGAVVYTDQSVSPPRLLLMYDLLLHQQPLAVDSFFDITFHVFEDGELEVYSVLCFGDNTFKVFEDGEDITDQADTVDCAVGFNGANVQVELEIDTLVTYSPDIPLFWSTHAPAPGDRCPPGQPGCNPEGHILLQPAPGMVQTSATMVIASSDGTTQVVGLPVGGLAPQQLCAPKAGGLLVDLLGLLQASPHGQLVSRVAHLSRQALDSLVAFGQIPAADAGRVHGCVVSTLAKK